MFGVVQIPIIGENICIPSPNGAYDIIVDPKDTKQVLEVEVNDNPDYIMLQKTES